jgi:hypothetical protein
MREGETMGTDIHMAVERRDRTTGKWYVVPPTDALQLAAREEYRRWLAPENTDEGMREWAERKMRTAWYDDRNYEAFAILADVRNGRAFAGVETGDGFKQIADPRGLPLDLSEELRVPANYDAMRECAWTDVPEDPPENEDDDEYRGFWLGDHSWSYLTVRELQAYDWTQVTALCGVIDWKEYVTRVREKQTGSPRTYSGDVWCRGCVTMDERRDDLSQLINSKGEIDRAALLVASARSEDGVAPTHDELGAWADSKLHVRVWWEETYAESAGRFYSQVLPELASLDPEHPDDVRIVFGFDS